MKKLILAVTLLALSAGITMGADIIAGNPKNGANVVGTVEVTDDGVNLTVVYTITDPDYIITETHLHVTTLDPANEDNYKKVAGAMPQKSGNAIPGQFMRSSSHDVGDGVTQVTHVIALADIPAAPGETLYVAAHAVVGTLCPCDELVLDLPSEVTVTAWYAGDPGIDDDSYFDILISGGTDLDGPFDAWCVDTDRSIRPPTFNVRGIPMQAMVFSSYDCASLPTVIEPLVEYCQNMDLVNWILNNPDMEVGDVSPGCGGTYTYGDIQMAIWELVDDTPVSSPPSFVRCRVDEIKAAAFANGEGFEPICGELVGVIILPYVYMIDTSDPADGILDVVLVEPDTAGPGYPGIPAYPDPLPEGAEIVYVQPVILTIPVPCCFCDDTAWAGVEGTDDPGPDDGDGYTIEFSGKDWSMYFTYDVPLPDLVVSDITLDSATVTQGEVLGYTYTVANIGGEGPIGLSIFDVAAYLSTDDILDGSDTELGQGYSAWSYHLSIGWSDSRPEDDVVISAAPGTYYLIVVADAKPNLPPNNYPGVTESDETNNTLAVQFTVEAAAAP